MTEIACRNDHDVGAENMIANEQPMTSFAEPQTRTCGLTSPSKQRTKRKKQNQKPETVSAC
jgi:hypothetical protein